jgi:hypothetical protein
MEEVLQLCIAIDSLMPTLEMECAEEVQVIREGMPNMLSYTFLINVSKSD